MEKERKPKILKKLPIYLFYASIFIFLISFNFQNPRTGGWYQQNMPNLGGVPLTDIFFADSLNGYATTGNDNAIDTSFVLKTTNGGDNWSIILTDQRDYARVFFNNKDTGFVCGGHGDGAKLYKTINGGINWISLNIPGGGLLYLSDMKVFSKDSIWVTESNTMVGGIFFTSNGGLNWQSRSNGLLAPLPNKMYFYNSRIGYASGSNLSRLFRTTNSGINWVSIPGNNGFNDIVFVDSLTGFKTSDSTRKTTDGGITWIAQKRPKLSLNNSLYNFALINKDTIWGVGGTILTSLGIRGILYITTNGGVNWGYQIPDTININLHSYYFANFLNNKTGWAYVPLGSGTVPYGGIHTLVGGNDTTFYTSISKIIQSVPKNFELKQNYPNPYNNSSLIEYYINESGWVKLKIFDIAGKEITTLVNEVQSTGGYGIPISVDLPSGVYFYKMIFTTKDGIQTDTKKMVVIK